MGEKIKLLARYLYRYKLYGIGLYIRLYWFKVNRVKLPGYGTLYLRRDTTDVQVFTQLFVFNQYVFNLDGEVKTIVDLGGNNGMSARFFHRQYPEAIIYVLEPDSDNFAALEKNIAGYDNIIAIKKAIWKEDGTIRLDDADSWAVKVDMEGGKKMAEAISMSALLSAYNIHTIDLLKVDVESAEKEIFSADISFLSKTSNLIIELHDWIEPGCSVAFFKALSGYSYFYSVNGENTLVRNLKKD